MKAVLLLLWLEGGGRTRLLMAVWLLLWVGDEAVDGCVAVAVAGVRGC